MSSHSIKKLNILLSALFFMILAGSSSLATPAKVILIRHGEKPIPPATGNQLIPQGCERAYLLPSFFQAHESTFGKPVAIYAAKPGSDDSSVRPLQTIAPTAAAYGLRVNDSGARLDYPAIAQEILTTAAYDQKTVVISWEHHVIPDFAQALGLELKKSMNTKKWPGAVFDQAWVLSFTQGSTPSVGIEILPEALLPTDNPVGGFEHWIDGPQDSAPSAAQSTVDPAIANQCATNDALNQLLFPLLEVPVNLNSSAMIGGI